MSAKLKVVQKIKVKEGKTVLEVLTKEGIDIKAPCKKGKCGKCLIRILEGKLPSPTKLEEKVIDKDKLEKGYRLACETEIEEDMTIEVVKKDKD